MLTWCSQGISSRFLRLRQLHQLHRLHRLHMEAAEDQTHVDGGDMEVLAQADGGEQTMTAVQYYLRLDEYEQNMEEYKKAKEAEALAGAPEASGCKKVIKACSKAKKELEIHSRSITRCIQ